ncbi:unnamed protein product, partial [Symbiodinium sp. KB8]
CIMNTSSVFSHEAVTHCHSAQDCHGHGTCEHQRCDCDPFWLDDTDCGENYVQRVGGAYWGMVGLSVAVQAAVLVAQLWLCSTRSGRQGVGGTSTGPVTASERQGLLGTTRGGGGTCPWLTWRNCVSGFVMAASVLRCAMFAIPLTRLQDEWLYGLFTLLLRTPQILWVSAYLCLVVVWFDMVAMLRRSHAGRVSSRPPGQRLKLAVKLAVSVLVAIYVGIAIVNVTGIYQLYADSNVPVGVYVLVMTGCGAWFAARVLHALQYLTAASSTPLGHVGSRADRGSASSPPPGYAYHAAVAASLFLGDTQEGDGSSEGAATSPRHTSTDSA